MQTRGRGARTHRRRVRQAISLSKSCRINASRHLFEAGGAVDGACSIASLDEIAIHRRRRAKTRSALVTRRNHDLSPFATITGPRSLWPPQRRSPPNPLQPLATGTGLSWLGQLLRFRGDPRCETSLALFPGNLAMIRCSGSCTTIKFHMLDDYFFGRRLQSFLLGLHVSI